MSQLLPWVQVTSAIALLVFTTSLLGQEPVQQASTTDRLRATIVHLSQTIGERNLTKAVKSLRKHCKVDVQSASLPSELQGVGWSDHWSFWQEGYMGLMVTDTALFRYPHYHEPTDTVDKIEFVRYAQVVDGLAKMVEDFAQSQ